MPERMKANLLRWYSEFTKHGLQAVLHHVVPQTWPSAAPVRKQEAVGIASFLSPAQSKPPWWRRVDKRRSFWHGNPGRFPRIGSVGTDAVGFGDSNGKMLFPMPGNFQITIAFRTPITLLSQTIQSGSGPFRYSLIWKPNRNKEPNL